MSQRKGAQRVYVPWTPAEVARAKRLRTDGLPWTEVGRLLDRSDDSCRRAVERAR